MATLILKATEDCNANCVYCDVVRKERAVRTMPLETLKIVFQRIDEFLRQRPEEDMTIIWHGGEPLLLGTAYYQSAYEIQESVCQETKSRIKHAMQSNLTAFDESFVPVLKQLGIDQIGSSFDPVAHVRGADLGDGRIDSLTYNRNFLRGDALAQKHGFPSGIIYVVTKKSLDRPLEIFHYLANLKLGSGFDFHPVLVDDKSRKGLAITPKQFVDFLGAIFPVWWAHRERYPDVDPFGSYCTLIEKRRQQLVCNDSGHCAYTHLNIGPDGSITHCGRSGDWGLLDYGKVHSKSLAQVMADEKRAVLRDRPAKLKETACKDCRFWTLCHGGCPLDSWFGYGDFEHKTKWCYIKRGFLEEYFEPITGLRFEPFHDH